MNRINSLWKVGKTLKGIIQFFVINTNYNRKIIEFLNNTLILLIKVEVLMCYVDYLTKRDSIL